MNTEPHYADGGEPHYKRVARLGLSWCRANITKYAERAKGTPVQDLLKVIDYAVMELEPLTNPTPDVLVKMRAVYGRLGMLLARLDPPNDITHPHGNVTLEDLDPPVEERPAPPPWPYPAGATTRAELEAGVFANLEAGLREMEEINSRRQDPSYQARLDAGQQEDVEALKGYLGQGR